MIFSSKAEYGVRLMIELGRQAPEHPTSLKAIADAEGLPLAYLEQVVARLRRAGLVMSARGAHGGYWLARPAEEISMDEVVQALEGSIAPMECFVHDHTERVAVLPRARRRAWRAPPSCCGPACRAASSARCRPRPWPSSCSSPAAAHRPCEPAALRPPLPARPRPPDNAEQPKAEHARPTRSATSTSAPARRRSCAASS